LAVLLSSSRGPLLELLAGRTRASIRSTSLTPSGVASSALASRDSSSSARGERTLARPVSEIADLAIVLEVARPLATTDLAASIRSVLEWAALESPGRLTSLAGQLRKRTLARPVGEVTV
jgi:hypothetical protein